MLTDEAQEGGGERRREVGKWSRGGPDNYHPQLLLWKFVALKCFNNLNNQHCIALWTNMLVTSVLLRKPSVAVMTDLGRAKASCSRLRDGVDIIRFDKFPRRKQRQQLNYLCRVYILLLPAQRWLCWAVQWCVGRTPLPPAIGLCVSCKVRVILDTGCPFSNTIDVRWWSVGSLYSPSRVFAWQRLKCILTVRVFCPSCRLVVLHVMCHYNISAES